MAGNSRSMYIHYRWTLCGMGNRVVRKYQVSHRIEMDIHRSVRFRRAYRDRQRRGESGQTCVIYRIRDSSSSGSLGMAPCCVQT